MKIKKAYADTPGGLIHYVEMGEGPAILLLSESPRSHAQYRQLQPLLADRFRAIAIDTPGYGASDNPRQPLSISSVCGQIVEFLDALGLAKVAVFGVHTGNKLAACLAAEHPDRVERVVLAGHTHSIIPETDARIKAMQPFLDAYNPRYEASPDGAHLMREWLGAQSTALELWWPNSLLRAASVEEGDIQDAEDRVVDFLRGWREVLPMYHAVFDYDLGGAYRAITRPALVLEYVTQEEIHLGAQAERIAAMMADARGVTLPVTYAQSMRMQASEIAQIITSFME